VGRGPHLLRRGFYLRLVEFDLAGAISSAVAPVINVLGAALGIHLVVVVVRGRSDDLIARRRALRLYALRLYFWLAMALVSLFMIGRDTPHNWGLISNMSLIRAIAALAMGLWAMLWVLKMREGAFTFETPALAPAKPPGIDPRDETLRDDLLAAMTCRFHSN